MNETVGVIFIDSFKTAGRHEAEIVWEQAEIDDYRDDCTWLEVGKCIYDVEKKQIIKMMYGGQVKWQDRKHGQR